MLEERSFPRIPYPEVTIKEIPKSVKGNILIISLNSCIGCGERRYFPPKIRELIKTFVEEMDNFPPNVQEIIKSFLNKDEGKDDKELMKLLYEDIDTPLINEDDIEKIIEYINSTDINTCLPIILTHHNLLPQKAPRVAMYTELINSGYFRDKLLKLNRPILYLHGHIHDDPIEIVQSSRYVNSKIICISAPLLYPAKNTEEKAGFNKIKIIYDHKEMPLGCEIINYRISSSNVEKKIEKIRFWDIFETQNFADEKDKAILKSIDDKLIHLIDLEEKVETEEGLYLSIDEIEKGLLRLSWLGLVRYNPQENDVRSSRFVQKVIP